jgi:hypothetical protein
MAAIINILPSGPARTMLVSSGLPRDDAYTLVEDAMDFAGPSAVVQGDRRYVVTACELDMFRVLVQ